MILFIVTDDWDSFQKPGVYEAKSRRLEEISGDKCEMVHYSELQHGLLAEHSLWAVCYSGGTDARAVDNPVFRGCVLELDVPQIGFCAGHQLTAKIFGSTIGPMRALHPGEPDPVPGWFPGFYKERGYYRVPVTRSSNIDYDLFAGLRDCVEVWQNHRYHITELAAELIPLAASSNCPVEAWKHRTRPFFGVQFHPEVHDEEHSDGVQILNNFFRLARRTRGE